MEKTHSNALVTTASVSHLASSESKRGFLRKKGGFFGTYNRYWVVLEHRTVQIFSLPSDRIPTFTIPLHGASVVVADHLIGKKYSLAIFPSASAHQKNAYPGAPLHLVADSDQERNDWLQAFKSSQAEEPGSPEQGVIQTVEAMIDSVVVSDPKGVVMAFNRAAEHMFGWTAEEIIGKNVSILMPEMYAMHHGRNIENYSRTSKKSLIGKPRKLTALRKNGTFLSIEISLGEMPTNAQGARFIAVFREVSVDEPTSVSSVSTPSVSYKPFSLQCGKSSIEEHKQHVMGMLDQHKAQNQELMESMDQHHMRDDLSTSRDLSDTDSEDGEGDLHSYPAILSEDDYKKQNAILKNHTQNMEKLALVTKHLDKIVKNLVHEAQTSAMESFSAALDSKMATIEDLHKLFGESKIKIQELEAHNQLLTTWLKSRTHHIWQLQTKIATLQRIVQTQKTTGSDSEKSPALRSTEISKDACISAPPSLLLPSSAPSVGSAGDYQQSYATAGGVIFTDVSIPLPTFANANARGGPSVSFSTSVPQIVQQTQSQPQSQHTLTVAPFTQFPPSPTGLRPQASPVSTSPTFSSAGAHQVFTSPSPVPREEGVQPTAPSAAKPTFPNPRSSSTHPSLSLGSGNAQSQSQPQPQPPAQPQPPRKDPVVLMSYAWEAELKVVHEQVCRLWHLDFLRENLDAYSPGRQEPSADSAVLATLLQFDIGVLEDMNAFLRSTKFAELVSLQEQTKKEIEALRDQVNQMRKKAQSSPAGGGGDKPGTPSTPSTPRARSSSLLAPPTTQSACDILGEMAEKEREFRKARALANFQVIAHKARLQKIHELRDAAKTEGSRDMSYFDFLKRMEERRLRVLEKWERRRTQIIAERDLNLSKLFLGVSLLKPPMSPSSSALKSPNSATALLRSTSSPRRPSAPAMNLAATGSTPPSLPVKFAHFQTEGSIANHHHLVRVGHSEGDLDSFGARRISMSLPLSSSVPGTSGGSAGSPRPPSDRRNSQGPQPPPSTSGSTTRPGRSLSFEKGMLPVIDDRRGSLTTRKI